MSPDRTQFVFAFFCFHPSGHRAFHQSLDPVRKGKHLNKINTSVMQVFVRGTVNGVLRLSVHQPLCLSSPLLLRLGLRKVPRTVVLNLS